ncbi:hypothetical protein PM082_019742 [Marasmius tenuissimus]|nr:hypothetical protein PM082_019742 [Marasmius tenuissimus]
MCVSRFPNPLRAIEYLRKNGAPSSTTIDIFNPGSRVEVACQSIVSLSFHLIGRANATASQIWTHWEPSVAKWIAVFLQMVLTSVHVPREEADNTILIYIVDVIPSILDAEDKATSATVAIKKGAAPYLQPLVAQVWLFLVDTEYPLIEPWSTLLIHLTDYTRDLPSSTSSALQAPPHARRFSKIPHPYPIDAKLGKRLLVQLQLKIRRFTKGKDLGVDGFKTFLMILVVGKQCFQGTNPICMGEENHNEALRLMGRILAIILRKASWLHEQPIESTQVNNAYHIATCLLNVFRQDLQIDKPSRIQSLVESGIVTSLYYTADCYYTLGMANADDETGGFIGAAASLLDQIATFLIHHRVLRALLRNIHRFRRIALDEFSPGIKQSKVLRHAWRNLLGKADELHMLRRTTKYMGLQCENAGCPIFHAPMSQKNLEIRYFRCSGCFTSIYCSPACQRADWRTRHKGECAQGAQLVRDGTPHMDRRAIPLIGLLLDGYTRIHARNITTMVKAHRRTNASARELQTHNPILNLNFNQPHLPLVQDATLHDGIPEEFAKTQPDLFGAVERQWKASGLNELVIWAVFPMQTGQATFPHTSVVKFPCEEDCSESFGRRWLGGLRED